MNTSLVNKILAFDCILIANDCTKTYICRNSLTNEINHKHITSPLFKCQSWSVGYEYWGFYFLPMKNFISNFKEYKSMSDEFNRKLVWNPKTNRWLVTSFFTKEYIIFKGMEVVAHG